MVPHISCYGMSKSVTWYDHKSSGGSHVNLSFKLTMPLAWCVFNTSDKMLILWERLLLCCSLKMLHIWWYTKKNMDVWTAYLRSASSFPMNIKMMEDTKQNSSIISFLVFDIRNWTITKMNLFPIPININVCVCVCVERSVFWLSSIVNNIFF